VFKACVWEALWFRFLEVAQGGLENEAQAGPICREAHK